MALVNGLDKSNNFNQLDEMQNHMSNLITAQNEMKTDDYVVRGKNNNKKDSEKNKTHSANRDNIFDSSSSSSEEENKTPQKGLKKQKLIDMSSSNSDNE